MTADCFANCFDWLANAKLAKDDIADFVKETDFDNKLKKILLKSYFK